MDLRFIGIDPNTGDDHCPAVFVDQETNDVVFQGWQVTDTGDLAQAARHSPLAGDEVVVRMPARMREIILRALTGGDEGGGAAAVR